MPILRCGLVVGVLLAMPLWLQVALANEICYTTATPASSHSPPNNATPFQCGSLGLLTLPQLAAQGWAIVRLGSISVAGGSMISDQLIVRRSGVVFRNGFEN